MKKIVCALVVVGLVISASLFYYMNQANANKVNDAKKYSFNYFHEGKDGSGDCWYTDNYFNQSANEYDKSLSGMSISLALSALGNMSGTDSDYTVQSKNVEKLLDDIGFLDIEANEGFKVKPTMDSVGCIIANKKVKTDKGDSTLIAIAMRGAGYEKEWASNLTIGLKGNHQGFSEGKDQVKEFLNNYITSKNISGDVKFWITGYSRGAAISNLLAADIDEKNDIKDSINYDNEDVYAYCFEAPQAADKNNIKKDVDYSNIHNIVNKNDFVTKVAPNAFDFVRFGKDEYMPTQNDDGDKYSDLKNNMINRYKNMQTVENKEYLIDKFEMKEIDFINWDKEENKFSIFEDDDDNVRAQNQFLDEYIDMLSKNYIKSRKNYVNNYQEDMRQICSVICANTSKENDELIKGIAKQAKAKWGNYLLTFIWNNFIMGDKEKAHKQLFEWIKIAADEKKIKYDEKKLKKAVYNIGDLGINLIKDHPNLTATLIKNKSSLAQGHYAELCYAWVTSLDENYNK